MVTPRHSGRLTYNVVVTGVPSADTVEAAGARWFNASASDLLGLASDLRVQEAALAALRRYSFARDAATEIHQELTAKLSRFLGRETALVSHPAALFALDALGIVEAVNSLDGSIAPLPTIFQERPTPPIIIDRHGLGILGEHGRGAVEHLGVEAPLVCTALGGTVPGCGLLVNAPKELLSELEADAPPTPALAATLRSLEILEEEKHRRERVFSVGERLFSYLRSLGLDTGPSVTPWIPVWLGDEEGAQRWLSVLSDARIAVAAWLSPGGSRLLLSIPATASDAQLESLFAALRKAQRKFAPPEGLPDSGPALIARPGTFATSIPAHPRWMPIETLAADTASISERASSSRLRDIFENFTWKLANVSGGSLERLSEVLRRGKLPRRP